MPSECRLTQELITYIFSHRYSDKTSISFVIRVPHKVIPKIVYGKYKYST